MEKFLEIWVNEDKVLKEPTPSQWKLKWNSFSGTWLKPFFKNLFEKKCVTNENCCITSKMSFSAGSVEKTSKFAMCNFVMSAYVLHTAKFCLGFSEGVDIIKPGKMRNCESLNEQPWFPKCLILVYFGFKCYCNSVWLLCLNISLIIPWSV